MESLCVNCQKDGETRMMLTNIPFFKDILVVSFTCPHCNYRNNEIQNAGVLAELGHKLTLTVTSREDLDRDICRGEFATTFIPELQLEIPFNKKGHMSTLEGYLTGFKEDLLLNQQHRKDTDPELADQIFDFLFKLDKYIAGNEDILPFHFIIDDPAGNSYIKNPHFPKPDPHLKIDKYTRSREQVLAMGYEPENEQQYVVKQEEDHNTKVRDHYHGLKKDPNAKQREEEHASTKKKAYTEKDTNKMLLKAQEASKKYSAHRTDFAKPIEQKDVDDEAVELETPCMQCGSVGYTRMCTCSIPYFKEIIIIAFTCDHCLHRETEVKTGGGISEKGKIYTINVREPEDINRDIFKSESAGVEIPELGCSVVAGSLGGIFSTVEGVLEKVAKSYRDARHSAR
jgi:zinc finger protein